MSIMVEVNLKFLLIFNGGYINATIFRKSNAHPEPLRAFGQIYVNKDKSLNLAKLELNTPKNAQNAQDIKIALKNRAKCSKLRYLWLMKAH